MEEHVTEHALADFAVFLADIEQGELRDDLSATQAEVVGKLKDLSKLKSGPVKGKMVLAITYVVEGKAVTVDTDIATKVPKPARKRDHFFVGKNGLTRRNPAQPELNFQPREIPGGKTEPAKEAAPDQAAGRDA